MNWETWNDQQRRLIILTALSEEADETMTDAVAQRYLERHAYRRGIDEVRADLSWLADAGALAVVEADGVEAVIVRLLRKGREHVDRRVFIEGVAHPDTPES